MAEKINKEQILDTAFSFIQFVTASFTALSINQEEAFDHHLVMLSQEFFNSAVEELEKLIPYEKEIKKNHTDLGKFMSQAISQLDQAGKELEELRPRVLKILEALKKEKHAEG